MTKVYPIFKRELKAYFNSPIAYIVISVFLLITGWFFTSNLFLVGQASLRGAFGIIPFIFVFFTPAITMKLLSEEKKSGSIELLTTMPVREWDIVFGKYLASVVLLVTAIVLTLPYFITIAFLGDVDGGGEIASYLGLMLMGSAYLSIGVLGSSLSENQVVGFIISFIIVFTLFLMDKFLDFVPALFAGVLEYMSIGYHFQNISRGVFDSRDIIYYLSLIACMLSLAKIVLESRKWRG